MVCSISSSITDLFVYSDDLEAVVYGVCFSAAGFAAVGFSDIECGLGHVGYAAFDC